MNLDLNSLQSKVDLPEINWEEHAPQLPIDQALWTDESLINPSETSVMEETPACRSTEFQAYATPVVGEASRNGDRAAADSAPENPDISDLARQILTHPDTQKTQPRYVQGVIRGQQAYIITNLCDRTSSTLFQPQMTWSIGRNRDAAIPLRDRMLSRHHSVLMYVRNSGFHLLDLNSMNGSYINGERLENRASLKDGDFLRVGNTEFFFFLSNGYRNLDALHPEILSRLVKPEVKASSHVDYAEIKEDISFNLNRG
jgi:pSer/pThr/pTyr-binding forkhead associated (FHA) protein